MAFPDRSRHRNPGRRRTGYRRFTGRLEQDSGAPRKPVPLGIGRSQPSLRGQPREPGVRCQRSAAPLRARPYRRYPRRSCASALRWPACFALLGQNLLDGLLHLGQFSAASRPCPRGLSATSGRDTPRSTVRLPLLRLMMRLLNGRRVHSPGEVLSRRSRSPAATPENDGSMTTAPATIAECSSSHPQQSVQDSSSIRLRSGRPICRAMVGDCAADDLDRMLRNIQRHSGRAGASAGGESRPRR
jgi:hypothetical protein